MKGSGWFIVCGRKEGVGDCWEPAFTRPDAMQRYDALIADGFESVSVAVVLRSTDFPLDEPW